jgi:hypothetical protein
MKQITIKTILKQGNNQYDPRFVVDKDDEIYWVDFSKNIEGVFRVVGKIVWSVRYAKPIIFGEDENSNLNECFNIVAQSSNKLEGVPTISLESYVKNLAIEKYGKKYEMLQGQLMFFKYGYKSNSNQYTQKDIEKAYDLGFEHRTRANCPLNIAINTINSISIIEVNENWEVINYY